MSASHSPYWKYFHFGMLICSMLWANANVHWVSLVHNVSQDHAHSRTRTYRAAQSQCHGDGDGALAGMPALGGEALCSLVIANGDRLAPWLVMAKLSLACTGFLSELFLPFLVLACALTSSHFELCPLYLRVAPACPNRIYVALKCPQAKCPVPLSLHYLK